MLIHVDRYVDQCVDQKNTERSTHELSLITWDMAILQMSSDSYRWTDHLPNKLNTRFLIGTLGMCGLIRFPLLYLHHTTYLIPLVYSRRWGAEFLFIPALYLPFDCWTSPLEFSRSISDKVFQNSTSSFSPNLPFFVIDSIGISL